MPTYEPKREHIRAAVESALSQTRSDWILLINDDASKREDVAAHVEPYLLDPRIRLERNVQNLGIGGNWNACFRQAETPYIAFLFQDDAWDAQYLERMLDALEKNPSAGFAASNHTYIFEGKIRSSPLYEGLQAFREANITPGLHDHRAFLRWWMKRGLHPNVIGEPSFVVLRRSLMEEVGPFNASMFQFLDCEYWMRCLLKADWYYVAEPLGQFRVHGEGMSAVNERAGRSIAERLITLEIAVASLPPEDKAEGRKAIVGALAEMIGKFFTRTKAGKPVGSKAKGEVRKFVLRHPFLTGRAAFAALWKSMRTGQRKAGRRSE